MTNFEARRPQPMYETTDASGGAESPVRETSLLLPEFGSPESFTYVSPEETFDILSQVGYGQNMMRADSFYYRASAEERVAVATYRIPAELCEGHFDIHRGVEQVEGMAQATLLLARFTRPTDADVRPLFTGIRNYDFVAPAVPGMEINVLIKESKLPEGSEQFQAEGEIVHGQQLLSYGIVRGVFAPGRLVDYKKTRQIRTVGKTQPVFPIRPAA